MRELPPAQLARLTQIDYDRAMAFIATRPGAAGEPETLGVVRAVPIRTISPLNLPSSCVPI
jgi:acetyl-CoA synthetase (ADP-forming)/acetyltransferase